MQIDVGKDIYPPDLFDEKLRSFFIDYKIDKKPIEVNFRELVPDVKGTDRFTHLIHRYPAKLISHIPTFFINNSILSKPNDWVLDPFCGSGTVLLESMLAGRNAIGSDTNPLARLISKVKTQRLDINTLKSLSNKIEFHISQSNRGIVPNVVNIDFWFTKRVKNELATIKHAIEQIEDSDYKDFFMICFSSCVKYVSFADHRVSVPVRLNYQKYPKGHPLRKEAKKKILELEHISASEKFFQQVVENIRRIKSINNTNLVNTKCEIFEDARTHTIDKLNKINAEKVSLIITSPPYAGAQKYIRSSSLNLGWLGFTNNESLRDLEKRNIGREHYSKLEYVTLETTGINQADKLLSEIYAINPLRSHIAANYLREMKEALTSSVSVLKKGGYFVLVAANNQVCNHEFMTREYLTQMLLDLGLSLELEFVDNIQSYGLMTKRNKTANVITHEWVMVLKKY